VQGHIIDILHSWENIAMSVLFDTLEKNLVLLATYQPELQVVQDVWQALHHVGSALVQIHDFSAVDMNRVAIRQAIFMLREHDAQQPSNSNMHTVIVASGQQGARFTYEIARSPGTIRLLPVFGSTEEAAVFAAMVVIKQRALSA